MLNDKEKDNSVLNVSLGNNSKINSKLIPKCKRMKRCSVI